MRILFLGDIVGRPGRRAVAKALPSWISSRDVHFVVANGENASGGIGIDPGAARELFAAGIDVLTSGNHIWAKKEIIEYLRDSDVLLRPANFPAACPGWGFAVKRTRDGAAVGVVNLIGRVFMGSADCPFRAADAAIATVRERTAVIVVDMHAEATSEKVAMGWYLDGRVSAVLGSHTHVPTADERVLPRGTAYQTDTGMCGPRDSAIGMRKEEVLHRFLTQMPARFEVASGPVLVHGALVDVDEATGRARSIERMRELVEM